MSVGTLTVNLLMKTGQFETDTKRAARASKKMADDIDRNIKNIATSLGVAAVAGVALFANSIKNAVDQADEMGKVAQKIGVSTEALSGLAFAASQSEVEIDVLQKALAKIAVDLTNNAGELQKLGINAKTADQALIQLADKFKDMPDGLQKTAAAAKIFGERIGPNLIPLLNLGSEGITQLKERAQELGIVISDEMARDADQFNDTMDEVKGAMQGAFLTASKDLLPVMQDFGNYMASSEAQEGIKNVTDLLITLGKVAFATASLVGSVVKNAQDDLTVAVNGQLFASDKKLKRQIDSAKQRLAQLENFAPGVDTDLKKSLRSDIAAYQAQQQKNLALSITNNIKDPVATSTPKVSGAGLESVLAEEKKKTGVSSGASKAAAEAARAKADADREAAEAARELESAYQGLNSVLDAQAVELGGPVVQAAINYRDRMTELLEIEKTYTDQGKLTEDVIVSLNQAREQALGLYQKETKAIQEQLTPGQEQILQMQEELRLLGLSNEERVKAIYLRENPGDVAGADQAADLASSIDQAYRAQQAIDQFRNSATDALASFIDGSASAKDAFTAFADSVIQQIARMLAEQAIAALFGAQGSGGGGSSGGWMTELFSAFAGRATGGGVSGNSMYRVNENGPEILNYKGEDFLMMGGNSGFVKQRGNGGVSNITVNLPPSSGRRSELQAAQRVAEESSRAMSRNR